MENDKRKRAVENRQKNIDLLMALYEGGLGSDIKGVRGSGYGLANALFEYADYHKARGSEFNEKRFESIHFGKTSKWKAEKFDQLIEFLN